MLDAHIVKARRAFRVEVRLVVERGDALALFGASGAGKSTVLACLAGTETPDDGYVRVGGRTFHPPPLPLHRRGIGYMTQNADLFPHLSVAQNVTYGLRGSNDRAWVDELRTSLHLEDVWSAPSTLISGGQARRVALARMLAPRPSLVLLDEPFAGLDRPVERELCAQLNRWRSENGFTLVVVDHRSDVLARLTNRAIVIEQGAAVQDGPWEAVHANPATELTAAMLAP